MTTKLLKRSWIEISIPTLLKNTQLQIQNSSSIMAVVKADAYGHGAVEVSGALQQRPLLGCGQRKVQQWNECSGVPG